MEPKRSESYPSEASSNPRKLSSSSDKRMKMKEIGNKPSQEINLLIQHSEATKISNVDDDILQSKTSSELYLFGPPNQLPSESSEEKQPDNSGTKCSSKEKQSDKSGTKISSPKSFTCRYCSRKFSTPQALGGHQKAHQQARKDEKGGHSCTYHPYSFNYYHPYSPYSPRHLYLYGSSASSSLYRRNLPLSTPSSPCSFGNLNPTRSGPGPHNEHRLRLESLQPQTDVSFPLTKPSISLFDMGSGVKDLLGGVSASRKTNSECGNREVINVDDEDEENARGLDLNLKL